MASWWSALSSSGGIAVEALAEAAPRVAAVVLRDRPRPHVLEREYRRPSSRSRCSLSDNLAGRSIPSLDLNDVERTLRVHRQQVEPLAERVDDLPADD